MRRVALLLAVGVLLLASVAVKEADLRRGVDFFGSAAGPGYRTAPEVRTSERAFTEGFRAALLSVEEKAATGEDYPPRARLVVASVRLTSSREVTEGIVCRWAVRDAADRIWQGLDDPCAAIVDTIPAGAVREISVTFLVAGDASAPYKVVARPVLFPRQ